MEKNFTRENSLHERNQQPKDQKQLFFTSWIFVKTKKEGKKEWEKKVAAVADSQSKIIIAK